MFEKPDAKGKKRPQCGNNAERKANDKTNYAFQQNVKRYYLGDRTILNWY